MGLQESNINVDYRHDLRVNWQCVLCNICALTRNGLLTYPVTHIDVLTTRETWDGLQLAGISYYYKQNIDYKNYVTPSCTNPLILKPTRERAIVEYILMENWCDEGVLIEALKSYMSYKSNFPELYKVADFYGLPTQTLDYWLKEAREDEEV